MNDTITPSDGASFIQNLLPIIAESPSLPLLAEMAGVRSGAPEDPAPETVQGPNALPR